jgi:hypothetical protein
MYLLYLYITDLCITLLLLISLLFCIISTLAPIGSCNSSLKYAVRTYT